MQSIIYSCTRGRTWITLRKYIASFILTSVIIVVVYGIEYGILIDAYGAPFLHAPIISLPFMEEIAIQYGTSITILEWMIWSLVMRSCAAYAVMICACFISKLGSVFFSDFHIK
ncbi:MAG: hypothetical protein Q4F11_08110, partial [Eubacteriales bacterium]|nr:hypothetical protein [Eubacteriales bacterium]